MRTKSASPQPLFRLPPSWPPGAGRSPPTTPIYQPATAEHPAGYLLQQACKQPANLGQLASLSLGGKPVLFSPADTPWLKPDECFVASVVTFEQLSVGGAWRQNLSTLELITGLRGQTIEPGADVRLTLHSRFVQPLLDLSLVLLGIPLVLSRASRNIFHGGGDRPGAGGGDVWSWTLACDALGQELPARRDRWRPGCRC